MSAGGGLPLGETLRRKSRGARSYHAGRAAEEIAERYYTGRDQRVRERRWRGAAGEIDLIVEDGDGLIFVEVKASEDFAQAAAQVSARQIGRISAAAAEYLERMPSGQATEVRFDVGLVDRRGRLEVLEAAFGI
ncbi:YraN family protein [Tropicimonas sp. IMCC6043]|uniref:YraN family protein n=1 Tax=Tropicimonas sp. IMCC6043 TaxID=2510645 RepID=UPI00101D0325|nr:YraN family protein [Tropicimonas sp. IMCC6043]RYH08313.1 hypothetical protein EU800_16900 [Tropicimonas sp. IMCC6043]